MTFTIPDESSAGHADQAEPKTLDFQALARRDTGVVSGCAVTAQTIPDMTVAVASGSVRVAAVTHAVTGASVTITANVTVNPRYDAIVADVSGVLSAIAGTPAPETTLDQPSVDLAAYAVLAIVYVGPGATTITSSELVGKRINQNPNAFHDEAHALNAAVHTGTLDDAQIPAGIARDAEVTSAVSTHSAASDPHGDRAAAAADATAKVTTHEGTSDPHTGYQKESEKGAASGYASLDSNTLVPAAQLPLPTSLLLGGVKAHAAVSHEFLTSVGTDGVPVGSTLTLSDVPALLDAEFALTGDITPTAISANQDNYNPTGLATASTIRLSTNDTTTRSITGIAGGTDGRFLYLHNVGPGNIVLVDDSTSTAGNRFALIAGNITMLPDAMVELQYDFTSQRWRTTTTSDLLASPTSFALTGDISPTAISANLDDYNPTGLATASVLRLSTNDGTARALGGLVGGSDGRIVFVHNLGPGQIVLLDEAVASTAANRFALNGNVNLPADVMTILQYDATSLRWRAIHKANGTTPALVFDTTNVAGTSNFFLRADDQIALFDATTPAAIGTAAVGSVALAAHRDHVHATGAGTPTTIASGDAAATGAGPAAAMSNHVHGMFNVYIPVTFAKQGVVAVTTDATAGRWYNDTGRTLTIASCRATAVTAPTGATLIVDVNKDGTTIYTTQGNRPAIAISGNTIKSTNPDVTTIADGSYLTVNVDQVGSTVAGSDLTVQVYLRG